MSIKEIQFTKRQELRKKILKGLENVPEGAKIKLDPSLLDELIFFKFENKKTKQKNKIPVWTGEFLRKLDLSELSFENAYLHAYAVNAYKNDEPLPVPVEGYKKEFFTNENMSEEDSEIFHKEYENCNDEKTKKGLYAFDFSYTNIEPDFSKIESDSYWVDSISGCNFEGVDLSETKYEDSYFKFCNMKNTKINYMDDYELKFFNCNLSDNDLSKVNINLNETRDWEYSQQFLCDMGNYKNTGLKIEYQFIPDDENDKLFYDIIKEKGLLEDEYYPLDCYDNNNIDKYREVFGKYRTELQIEKIYGPAYHHARQLWGNHRFVEKIKSGDFDGCYLNGKLIDSKTINKRTQTYEELMSSITSSIEEQKRNLGK